MSLSRVALALSLRRVACRAPAVTGVALRSRLPLTQHCAAARQFHATGVFKAAGASETFVDRASATERVVAVVKNFEKVDPTKVTAAARFKDDLGLDSLDAVEVVMAIEDEFAVEIPDTEADKILSVEDAITYIVSHPMAK